MFEFRINDVFWTFQGEGANWGRRALFIRLPFCNLKCDWCDTEFNSFSKWTEEQLVEFMKKEPTKFAVITGGEPTMNKDCQKIVTLLKENGFEVAVESNGSFPIPYGIDFVTISPKKDRDYEIHSDACLKASEIKIVVDEGFDFEVCKKLQSESWTNLVRLSLSPEYGRMEESVEKITQFIKENPRWRLSLQTHKWLKIQ